MQFKPIINGTGLTQTTKVTFGGVNAATFTVNSATKVTATVPTGAVDGKIAITTPGGTAASAGTFTVHRLSGRCLVSNGKLTGYCIGALGGICHEAYDPTRQKYNDDWLRVSPSASMDQALAFRSSSFTK